MIRLNALYQRIVSALTYVYNKTHWFTDKDAWALYRIFAIGEAVGWTLLIGAIIYRKFNLPGYEIVVSICGRTHGILFGLYFIFTLITARSMMWNFWKLLLALIAGMPPYTSLIFEQIIAYRRKKHPQYVAPPAES